ncbi:flavin-containing monooxygenase [Streptomyces cavernicola]|uniref:NAD(P)/FAD-dependent oxidoreductase n=1 Tax=Streptomyces cavernicola TaxID=3043613 RepID=A0ABT6S5I8_9ACTN|nr:NAD(P)/FAD-dependent oxidoreductase [Streptomyces sp. B-S-A6]MDI3402581.1 NAD(P)/FAD-dependent oxidoreductase [Streptomyces sp. B-S-A6]
MEYVDVAIIGGGQSGLAAAHVLRGRGLQPVILEASAEATGSWPDYYDSLTLFSPARFSALPGLEFGGDGDRYPHRDEVVEYLARYASRLDAEIRTRTRVETVERSEAGFLLRTDDGRTLGAAGVVAATGAFGNPVLPDLPGRDSFVSEVLHVADYRDPAPYAGKRVVVVGGGNSAVQVGHELAAEAAQLTLASRNPVRFLPQTRDGKDLHHWLTSSGFDQLPPEWLIHYVGGTLVLDNGRYRDALESGRLRRRPMFTALDGDEVVWGDGSREPVDVALFATGYRPHLDYLAKLGALDEHGLPLHSGGISATHPGLVYLGLEFQRSFASNTLRGVARDAEYVADALVAHVRKAPTATGL